MSHSRHMADKPPEK